jgi:hypothetical protein
MEASLARGELDARGERKIEQVGQWPAKKLSDSNETGLIAQLAG